MYSQSNGEADTEKPDVTIATLNTQHSNQCLC